LQFIILSINESALKLWDEQQIFKIDLLTWFYLNYAAEKSKRFLSIGGRLEKWQKTSFYSVSYWRYSIISNSQLLFYL
jgi:hypothetical protein